MARETKKELQEKYRQAVIGLRHLAAATDDLLVHEILDETFERIGESKEFGNEGRP